MISASRCLCLPVISSPCVCEGSTFYLVFMMNMRSQRQWLPFCYHFLVFLGLYSLIMQTAFCELPYREAHKQGNKYNSYWTIASKEWWPSVQKHRRDLILSITTWVNSEINHSRAKPSDAITTLAIMGLQPCEGSLNRGLSGDLWRFLKLLRK